MIESSKNSCAFYASDYHLEMIMLPYINENFKNNNSVYIFTQNNLTDTINTLIERVNINDNTKQKILNINWKKDDENKYKEFAKDKQKATIFVKGNKEYIEKINNNLNQFKSYKKFNVVDCYDIQEVNNEVNNISNKYANVLKTLGKF